MSNEIIALYFINLFADEIKNPCKDKGLHESFEEMVEAYQLFLKYLENDYLNL